MDATIFKIREYRQADRAYIAKSISNTWISCRKNTHRSIEGLNRKIDFILDKCVTKVVCLTEDEDNIVAFIIVQPVQDVAIVHALFVRGHYRRLGIARSLLKKLSTRYMIVAQSLNYCDEDKILPTFKKVFLEVIDKTDAWKADRSEHGTQA